MVGGNKERIKDAPVLIVSTFERGKSGFFQGNPLPKGALVEIEVVAAKG